MYDYENLTFQAKISPAYGKMMFSKNGMSSMSFEMQLRKSEFKQRKQTSNAKVGSWNAAEESAPIAYDRGQRLAKVAATNVYKVVVVEVSDKICTVASTEEV